MADVQQRSPKEHGDGKRKKAKDGPSVKCGSDFPYIRITKLNMIHTKSSNPKKCHFLQKHPTHYRRYYILL